MRKGLGMSKLVLGTAISALAVSALSNLAFGQVGRSVILTDQGPRELVITPYILDEETENIRILLDGNRITHKSVVKVYRDSAGRLRREEHAINAQGVPEEVPLFIYIDDPIAGIFYSLNPRDRTGRKLRRGDAIDFSSGRPTTSNPHQPDAWRGADGREYHSEPIGSQVLEGFYTEGTRITEVIPAGAQGNEQPIEIVTERWVSPELHISLLTKLQDPRSGQTVSQMTNIRLEEPSPDLFLVPADYAIEEARPAAPNSQSRPARE